MTTRLLTARPAAKTQVRNQRLDFRGYPPSGQPWGQPGWPHGGVGDGDPHINSLSPSTVAAAAAATTVTVNGYNFVSGSEVEIDQVAQTTTFVSATQLTISYDPTVAGTVTFTVRNPNDEESNGMPFVVTAAEREPTSSWNKTEIVEWLVSKGVEIGDDAVDRFTKDELLAIVEAYLNDDESGLSELIFGE